jgi:DNA-binding MarR family transcriptional regulator
MPEEPSADDLQRRLVAFVRAFGLHQPDETPCGAPIPVSEAHALTVLAGGDERGMSQTDLGRWLRLGKSTVSRLVDQLEGRGWVLRRTGDDDSRRRLVVLTTEGRKAADDIGGRRAARVARLLDRIPEAERPAVLAALDVLAEAARAE